MMTNNSLSLLITTNSMKDLTESMTSRELIPLINSEIGVGSTSDSTEPQEKLKLMSDGKEKKNNKNGTMSNTLFQNSWDFKSVTNNTEPDSTE